MAPVAPVAILAPPVHLEGRAAKNESVFVCALMDTISTMEALSISDEQESDEQEISGPIANPFRRQLLQFQLAASVLSEPSITAWGRLVAKQPRSW